MNPVADDEVCRDAPKPSDVAAEASQRIEAAIMAAAMDSDERRALCSILADSLLNIARAVRSLH